MGAREALARTTKRIKTGEKEVAELGKRAEEASARVALLEKDLKAIEEGVRASAASSSIPDASSSIQTASHRLLACS